MTLRQSLRAPGKTGERPFFSFSRPRLAGAVPTLIVSLLFFFGGLPGTARAFHKEDSLGLSLFDSREQAPEIRAPDLSGKTLNLSDFRGKVVLLNFWATWCDSCRDEIPALLSLEKSLSGVPFVVVSVAMDRQTAHISPFAKKYGIDYPVLEGRRGKVDSRYFGMGLPQSYVIRPDGSLLGRVMGARAWNSPDFVNYFKALAVKSPAGSSRGGKG
ncbi:MAG: TlpA disulfide reductase family protein [Leptospirales bacterium]